MHKHGCTQNALSKVSRAIWHASSSTSIHCMPGPQNRRVQRLSVMRAQQKHRTKMIYCETLRLLERPERARTVTKDGNGVMALRRNSRPSKFFIVIICPLVSMLSTWGPQGPSVRGVRTQLISHFPKEVCIAIPEGGRNLVDPLVNPLGPPCMRSPIVHPHQRQRLHAFRVLVRR